MNMKTLSAVAAAFCGLCNASAHAQSSVTLYGLIDTGIEYVNHADATGSSNVYRMASGNTAGSRWGLRGREDLGGDLAAVFALESGFNSDNGSSAQGGRLFGRQAYVGIAGSWGQVTLGRQINTLFDIFVPFDPVRYSTYSILSQDAQFTNRADNVIKYTGVLGGLTVTGLYTPGYDTTVVNGGEVPGSFRIGQEISAGATYTTGNISMALAFDQRRGQSTATASAVERRYVGALSYSFGALGLMGGYRYLQSGISTPNFRSNLYWVGASYAFSPGFELRAGAYRTDMRGSSSDANSYALSALYALSKRTSLYANASYMNNKGASNFGVVLGTTTAPGINQTGLVVGARHVF
ncbi:porin [Cupriavidus sp. 2TAF22]|uniref:porin n=1 Tax=unclassified Cupriavidus TaxID=2640874 RepID=UPI003F912532